jgi:predicted DCC family thiol-disulfide oxidoreductase YuxK
MVEIENKIKLGGAIVLYDGVCGLCNRFIQLILRYDHTHKYMFASLQSDFAFRILSKYGANPRDLNSIYVIANYGLATETVLSKAKAAIFIFTNLGGIWRLLGLLNLVPEVLLDAGYNLVAANRYKLFGKYDSCLMPNVQVQERFIEV